MVVVVLAALTAAVAFPIAAWSRVPYPFEIEWLESEILQHVDRVDAMQPL